MTTYPADAIEAALKTWEDQYRHQFKSRTEAMAVTLAAFDAAMLAHGWKRVRANALTDEAQPSSARYPTDGSVQETIS